MDTSIVQYTYGYGKEPPPSCDAHPHTRTAAQPPWNQMIGEEGAADHLDGCSLT